MRIGLRALTQGCEVYTIGALEELGRRGAHFRRPAAPGCALELLRLNGVEASLTAANCLALLRQPADDRDARLAVAPSAHGLGAFASRPCSRFDALALYSGVVCTEEEVRSSEACCGRKSEYVFKLSDRGSGHGRCACRDACKLVVDGAPRLLRCDESFAASLPDAAGAFVLAPCAAARANDPHPCPERANAKFVQAVCRGVDGCGGPAGLTHFHIFLVATRHISAGEEVLPSYGHDYWEDEAGGGGGCGGRMGGGSGGGGARDEREEAGGRGGGGGGGCAGAFAALRSDDVELARELHDACAEGCAQSAQPLLDRIAAMDGDRKAAVLAYPDVARAGGPSCAVCSAGSDVCSAQGGVTALHHAVLFAARRCRVALSAASSSASAASPHHPPPPSSAPCGCSVRLLRQLLRAGAPRGARDAAGNTPLCRAAEGGCPSTVAVLLSSPASSFRPSATNSPPHSSARDADSHLEVPDDGGYTPLLSAIQRGHARVVRLLLRSGADRLAANTDGKCATEVVDDVCGEAARAAVAAVLREEGPRRPPAKRQLGDTTAGDRGDAAAAGEPRQAKRRRQERRSERGGARGAASLDVAAAAAEAAEAPPPRLSPPPSPAVTVGADEAEFALENGAGGGAEEWAGGSGGGSGGCDRRRPAGEDAAAAAAAAAEEEEARGRAVRRAGRAAARSARLAAAAARAEARLDDARRCAGARAAAREAAVGAAEMLAEAAAAEAAAEAAAGEGHAPAGGDAG